MIPKISASSTQQIIPFVAANNGVKPKTKKVPRTLGSVKTIGRQEGFIEKHLTNCWCTLFSIFHNRVTHTNLK